jgi:hypothetical protein
VYTSHAELFDGARLWNFSRVKAWMLEGHEREIQIQRSRIAGVNGEEEFKDEEDDESQAGDDAKTGNGSDHRVF